MKLTVNLNDPMERENCKAILTLWDGTDETEETAESEEYTYLPEDKPEPVEETETEAVAEPAAPEEDTPAEIPADEKKPQRAKAKVPPSGTTVTLEEAQTLAKRLAREKEYNSDKIRPLFSKYNDAAKISDLSEEDRAKFAHECLEILGEADV